MANDMAEQLDKASLRVGGKMNDKRWAKKMHKREKRRQAKNLQNENPQYNRYTSGWLM